MFKDFEETFTNDIRFRNEIVSLDCDAANELEEHVLQSTEFSQEEIERVWHTLANMFGKNSNKYIMTYLVFYLGYSYRDASNVLDISVSWGHNLVEKAIESVRESLAKEDTDEHEID